MKTIAAALAALCLAGLAGGSAPAAAEPLYTGVTGDYIDCRVGRNGRDLSAIDCSLSGHMNWPFGKGFETVARTRALVGNPDIRLRCVGGGRDSREWRRAGAILVLDRPFDARAHPHVVNTLLRDALRRSRQVCPYDFVGLPHLGFVTIAAPRVPGGIAGIVLEARQFGLGIWNDYSFGGDRSVSGYAPRRPDPPGASVPAAAVGEAGFLIFPLTCADPACRRRYDDPYAPGSVNSVLDHSMIRNPNGFWQFGSTRNRGGDGVVAAFNGEIARGRAQSAREPGCISGLIELRPAPGADPMITGGGCGSTLYASYDEHPGYDYRAAPGTPVRAAGSGLVVRNGGERCFRTNIRSSCDGWGYVGIDHGNGYITQYGHLSRIDVAAGQPIWQGDPIGLVGDRGVPGAPHLHFEVLRRVGDELLVVDPYGWVGAGEDPLYSAAQVPPRNLWMREPR